MCLAMVPTLKALLAVNDKTPNITTLEEYIGDAMKIIAQAITKSNEFRMERI